MDINSFILTLMYIQALEVHEGLCGLSTIYIYLPIVGLVTCGIAPLCQIIRYHKRLSFVYSLRKLAHIETFQVMILYCTIH